MIINGKDVIVEIYDDGVWKMFVCSRSSTINVSTETIETSTKGTGNWATFKATKDSWTMSAEGLVSINVSGKLTLPEIRVLQLAHTPVRITYQRTDIDGNIYSDQGFALIVDSQDTSSFDNVATFSMEFKGTGPLTQIFTPTGGGGKVKRLEYTGIGGEVYFEDALLNNVDIVAVDKDGIGRAKLILVGSPDPTTKEVLYEANYAGTGVGRLTFAQPFEPNEMSVVLYQDL